MNTIYCLINSFVANVADWRLRYPLPWGHATTHLSSHTQNTIWFHVKIFTMVTYFLRWTLLKLFSSFPDEQSQQKVRQLDRITCAVINTSNEVKSPLLWEFWIYNYSLWILERVLGWKHCKYKEWVSLFLGSWGMNRSAEQTNRPRTALRFTRFVCPALRFIPHEPRKKDTHSLIVKKYVLLSDFFNFTKIRQQIMILGMFEVMHGFILLNQCGTERPDFSEIWQWKS